ncbi:MAG: LysM peptidoglycan-binding domain-containing protein [Lachnospiraceae bacterium]|nr:LysM peptidoglycan-binding domain-containing protein [Lachnospiraceae bacterium]
MSDQNFADNKFQELTDDALADVAGGFDPTLDYTNALGYSGTVYTIKSGDTLAAIALKYGTTVPKLCLWNGIAKPDQIEEGMRIIVRLSSKAAAPSFDSPAL